MGRLWSRSSDLGRISRESSGKGKSDHDSGGGDEHNGDRSESKRHEDHAMDAKDGADRTATSAATHTVRESGEVLANLAAYAVPVSEVRVRGACGTVHRMGG